MSSPDLISEIVKPLERDLGLREGFFVELQGEDDWSFIIKGHAFLEAVFSHILTRAIAKDELKDVITNLELSNARIGKLAFADALGLVNREDRRFLRWFAELRNRVVHDVTQTRFDIAKYVSSLDTNQRRSFLNAVTLSAVDAQPDRTNSDLDATKYALESPKEAIWVAIMTISARMYFGPTFPVVFVLLMLLQAWIEKASRDAPTSSQPSA